MGQLSNDSTTREMCEFWYDIGMGWVRCVNMPSPAGDLYRTSGQAEEGSHAASGSLGRGRGFGFRAV